MPRSGSITACLFLLFSPRIKGPYLKKNFFKFFLSVLLLAGAKHWLGPQAAAGKAPSQEQKAGLGETGGGETARDAAQRGTASPIFPSQAKALA